MSSRSPYRAPTRFHVVHRNPLMPTASDALLSQVREHTERGERVRVCRYNAAFYDVVRNGTLFLVLAADVEAPPIGTFDNVAAAIMAGDQHVGDVTPFNPRGAA